MSARRSLPAVLLLVAAASLGQSVASAQPGRRPPPPSVATALSLTPPGTFATVNPAAFGTRAPTALGGDYATLSNASSFGVRLDQRGARLQAGVITVNTTGDRTYMGAIGYGGPLYTRPLSAVVRVHFGYDVAVGYGRFTAAAPPALVEIGAVPSRATFNGLTAGGKFPVGITYTPAWAGLTLTRTSRRDISMA